MAFVPGEMPVFDRTGARIGTLTKWAVSTPRSFQIGQIDNFAFVVPRNDEFGQPVLTAAVWALLKRDNMIYIEDEVLGLPGWGGVISEVTAAGGMALVQCLSGDSLMTLLETTTISQSGGDSAIIAQQLVAAAAAKQGAHGDLVVNFVADGTTNNYGRFTYEGDIYSGLQQLATETLAEFYGEATLSSDGQQMAYTIHWSDRFAIDYRATRTIHDGPGGNLQSGTTALFSGLEVLNRARLKGAPTNVANFVDYDGVRSVIQEVVPEADVILDATEDNYRRREDLTLSVGFGLSDDSQKAIAQAIQQVYLEYYKSFLYAYHMTQGKPYLDGYDWTGPDSTNEANLTESDFETFQALGLVWQASVITGGGVDNSGGTLDGWALDGTMGPYNYTGGGIALNYNNPAQHYAGFADAGFVSLLNADGTTTPVVMIGNGENLLAIATDPADASTLWTLSVHADDAFPRVRWFDIASGVLIGSYGLPGYKSDMAIDVANGLLYLAATDSGRIEVRDLANGLLLDPDLSFDSGFDSVGGISISGGIVYVIDPTGKVRMLYGMTGNLAGTFDTQTPASNLFVDAINHQVYIVDSYDSNVTVFHANVALGVVEAPGGIVGAPGFDAIYQGQFIHILMRSRDAFGVDPGAPPPGSGTADTVYTVVSGDTLSGISLKFYKTTANWNTIYKANQAVIDATAKAHGYTSNFSHWIFPGEKLTIPATGTPAPPPSTGGAPPSPSGTRWLQVHTPGHWETTVVAGSAGQPDSTQKAWVLEADAPMVGFMNQSDVLLLSNMRPDFPVAGSSAIVVFGEEGRVSDWNPRTDGYGHPLDSLTLKTPNGRVHTAAAGYYPWPWDVPDSTWAVPKPDWPEGKAYLNDYLRRMNAEVSIQTFRVLNVDNLWADLRRGGIYHFHTSVEGPVEDGIELDIRVLSFIPNELTGLAEIAAEAYIP
jgi:LysM repeat protein